MAPRLKPLSDDKALAAIPVDEPVLVELEPDALVDDIVEEPRTPRKKDEDDDPGVAALQKQLDDAKAASERDRQAAADARRDADEARRAAAQAQADKASSDEVAIANSIDSARAELKAAKAAVKTAFEAGDAEALADAQERVGTAAAEIRDFERAADDLKTRKETKPAPKAAASVDEAVDANPQLLPAEKEWMKAHPEVVLDPVRNQELGTAYHRAVRAGKQRGTPEYFAFIDEFMGFKPAASGDEADEEDQTIVAAPVSREARGFSGKPASTSRIKLTPAERQLASDMGLTDVEYARGKVQMETDRAADPQRFARR